MVDIRTGQTAEQDEHKWTARVQTFQMEFGKKNVTVNPLERGDEVFFLCLVFCEMLLAWAEPVQQKLIIHTGNQRSIKTDNDTVERRRRE